MKQKFLGFCAAALAFGVVACNNDGNSSATGDSTSTTTTTTSTTGDTSMSTTMTSTSTGSYAAMADSVERNSQQGYYLNPRTGQPYKSLRVDRNTGRITDDAGEPVWRYVDRRNWWVWGDEGMDTSSTWGQVGEARMQGNKIEYKAETGDKWSDYDTRYKMQDEDWIKKRKVSDGGNKQKIVTQDGDKIKMKTDEDGDTKIKVNDQKIKVDKDGNVKKD